MNIRKILFFTFLIILLSLYSGGDGVTAAACCSGEYWGMDWVLNDNRCNNDDDCPACSPGITAICIDRRCNCPSWGPKDCSEFKDSYSSCMAHARRPGGGYGCTWNCAPPPTSTPTPTPARPSLCQLATVSQNTLRPGESLTITSMAKSSNIKSFTYGFYNLDNLYGSGNPKPIYFTANTHYVVSDAVATPTNTHTRTVSFSDLDKPDLNWNSQKPVKIQVNAYFTNTENQFSAPEAACVVTFTLTASQPTATTAPTATSVPGCDCSATANTCAAVCPVNQATNKFSDITYTEPVKCSLTSTINVPTPATAQEKTSWCNRPGRTKGDADGNGVVNDLDYIYYMRAVMRAPLPGSINPDFNGDGDVTTADLVIWQHAR